MNIIETLLDTTHFETAKPLWQDGTAKSVFSPFFACMMVNLTSNKECVWHETYAKHSANLVRICLEMGTYSDQLDTYWRVPHLALKEKLVQNTGVDDGVLAKVLPISAFLAYQKIKLLADAQNQSVDAFAKEQLADVVPYLPAWADAVIDDELLASLNETLALGLANKRTEQQTTPIAPTTSDDGTDIANDDKNDDNDVGDDGNANNDSDGGDDDIRPWHGGRDETPNKKTNPALIAGALALLIALAGGGYYWYTQKNKPEPPPKPTATAPKLVTQNRPDSTIAITVGQAGELYACHARFGSSEQSQALLGILGESFTNITMCTMDISEQVSQATTGFDRLKTVLALLKTVPFASFEMIGDKVFINAPNPADADRLVADIGLLWTGMKVARMPELNADDTINQSLGKASELLKNFSDGGNPYELAQAMSVQKIDTQSGTIPEINKALLALSAGKIASNPDSRFIIVVHSDDTGDRAGARSQTQALAEAIKAELMAQGAGENQLVPQGVGFDFPISDNQTELGRFKNRRVEFLVYDDGIMQALNPVASAPLPPLPPLPPPPAPAKSKAPTTFAVVDGKIVEQGDVIDPEMAVGGEAVPQTQAPTPEKAPPAKASPKETLPPPPPSEIIAAPELADVPIPEVPMIEEPETQIAPDAPAKSPIPDDLVKPLGSDGAGAQSSQVIGTE